MVVTHRTVEKLIDRFIENGNPYYAIVTGSGVHNKNEIDSDIDNAADRLRKFLNETEGSEATYTINTFKVIPKGGIKKNSEADTVLTFKQQKYSPEEKAEYRTNRSYFEEKLLDKFEELQNTIIQQQALINSMSDEEIETEAEPTNPYLGMIGAALEHPVVSQILTGLAAKLFNNTNTNKPMALAGTETPNTVTLEQIIQTLYSKGVTIEHLYKLSQFDEAKIKMLLTML
jgi:hypothetical protein